MHRVRRGTNGRLSLKRLSYDWSGFWSPARCRAGSRLLGLGESLDALSDLLHGGYGALAGATAARIRWRDMASSRAALGPAETRRLLVERRALRRMFNGALIACQIDALDAGRGTTYFDIVIAVVAVHPSIAIVPA